MRAEQVIFKYYAFLDDVFPEVGSIRASIVSITVKGVQVDTFQPELPTMLFNRVERLAIDKQFPGVQVVGYLDRPSGVPVTNHEQLLAELRTILRSKEGTLLELAYRYSRRRPGSSPSDELPVTLRTWVDRCLEQIQRYKWITCAKEAKVGLPGRLYRYYRHYQIEKQTPNEVAEHLGVKLDTVLVNLINLANTRYLIDTDRIDRYPTSETIREVLRCPQEDARTLSKRLGVYVIEVRWARTEQAIRYL